MRDADNIQKEGQGQKDGTVLPTTADCRNKARRNLVLLSSSHLGSCKKKPKVSILVAVTPAATPVPGRLHDRLFHTPLRNAWAELRLGHAHGPFRVVAHDVAAAEPPSPLAAALAALEEAASLKSAARAAAQASILCSESFVSRYTVGIERERSRDLGISLDEFAG